MKDYSKGEALLLLVDAYNVEDKKAQKNFRNKNYKNPFYDNYSEVLEVIQQRNEKADLDGFIYHLGFLRSDGTLRNENEKEYLEEQFNAFKIDVPEWVKNCLEEIDFRTSFIEKFLTEKEYKWKQEQVKEYKEDLEQELQEFTFNTSTSRSDYLKEKFNSTSEEIKGTENQFRKVYKYDVSGFYKNHKISATKDDLNNLYYNAEKEKGTINEFWEIHKLLKKYFDLKNQLPVIKDVIGFKIPQVTKETKPIKELMWFKVGLKFATGEIQKYSYSEYSAPQIAKAVGLPGGEKNILATINSYGNDKDMYASRMKMQIIIDHCQENNIPIDPDFLSNIPSE